MAVLAIAIVIGLAVVLLAGGGSDILGTNLTATQIMGYAQNAGFQGDDLITAIAVALAESSGNPNANGDLTITPGGSVGLWQINLKAHPEFAGEDLTDPQTNANAAYSVYQAAGNSFSPWSTYSSGAYEAYMVQANNAVNA
jgi:Lysozyme like domain